MNITRNFQGAAALLSLAGLSLAAPALALGPEPGEQPQGKASTSQTRTVIVQDEGEFGISRENGTTTIKVHGKPITLDADGNWKDPNSDLRVERRGGSIVVYRGDKIVGSMNENRFPSLGGADAQWAWPSKVERPRSRLGPRADRLLGMLGETDAPQPRVMLGVTLSSVDEASAEAANVSEPEKATMINRVFKGLPADKAGLEDGDIIVEINGSTNATPEALRETLAQKKPGETLRLKVVRDGGTTELTVDLVPYDPERMGAPRAYAWARGGDFFSDDSLKQLEELRTKLALSSAQMQQLRDSLHKDAASGGKGIEELARRMAEVASKMGEQSAELARLSAEMSASDLAAMLAGRGAGARAGGGAFGFGGPRSALRFFNENGAPMAVIVEPDDAAAPTSPPSPPTPPTPSTQPDDRIKQIDRRIERLEKLLERMIEERTQASQPGGPHKDEN